LIKEAKGEIKENVKQDIEQLKEEIVQETQTYTKLSYRRIQRKARHQVWRTHGTTFRNKKPPQRLHL
jgi:hypothetical protein